ncbi:MAG: hypothetical protein EZS28_000393 [Streblomastix strix]|uniref:Uncharacterized protein n=1 Tax=Streblomastix strix TaxID=222440 RepID=A0A5J4X9U5_9EUKA|nr:MAG: hypothetical protein EZS28_000393 [Streblomastix strix]
MLYKLHLQPFQAFPLRLQDIEYHKHASANALELLVFHLHMLMNYGMPCLPGSGPNYLILSQLHPQIIQVLHGLKPTQRHSTLSTSIHASLIPDSRCHNIIPPQPYVARISEVDCVNATPRTPLR